MSPVSKNLKKKKILLVAMPSSHFFRWVSHINLAECELYWYNLLNMDYEQEYNKFFKKVFNTYTRRKLRYIKGEYFLSKKAPQLYSHLRSYLEVTENEIIQNIINEIQPEIVHSFEMQSCTYPITNALFSQANLQWIYSCWGSDLFYYQNEKRHRRLIVRALKRINYIHTDNLRDQKIARSLGFKGRFTEVIPGGGGYDPIVLKKYFKHLDQRKFILIKGYEHKMGRSIKVIEALSNLIKKGYRLEIIIFGAHPKLIQYAEAMSLKATIYRIGDIDHREVLKLMGESLIYIGNSISDGMPNTLLEAFLMGSFPIQSNPGGVTAELIKHKINGGLINNPDNSGEIEGLIKWAIDNEDSWKKEVLKNKEFGMEKFSYETNQLKINALYSSIKS